MPTPPKKFAGPSALNAGYHNFNWDLVFDEDGNLTTAFKALIASLSSLTLSGNLTLSALASGRVLITSTAGLIIVDDLYWDATNNRLGIGISSPAATLDVMSAKSTFGDIVGAQARVGDATAYNGSPAAGISFYTKYNSAGTLTTGGGIVVGKANATDGDFGYYMDLCVRANGSDPARAIRIDHNGQVGVFKTTPLARLHVKGSVVSASLAAILETGLASGGAANDYVEARFRHVNAGSSLWDGAYIRSIVVDPAGRDAKLALYGSDNEVATLGLEVGPTGALSVPVSLTFSGGGTALSHYEEGTFTATLTGCTTSPTVTARYVRVGKVVTLYIPTVSATSNATACTLTGLPASILAARTQFFRVNLTDNGTTRGNFNDLAQVDTTSTITFYFGGSPTGFTNAGTKGWATEIPLTYILS